MSEALTKALAELETAPSCSTADLAAACRLTANDESTQAILNNSENPGNVIRNLLEISLEGRADEDTNEPDLKRTRIALRTLVNFCNRSTRLKTSVTDALVPLSRCILRIPELQVEACAFLVSIANNLHKESLLHKDYPALLTDLASLWHVMEDHSWITTFFLNILETDFAFLSLAFRELSTETFATVLEITETLLDHSETDLELKVHPNNVIFCVDLIERLLYDLGESTAKDAALVPQLLTSVMDIIGNCALRPKDYGNELLSKPRAVYPIVDVLEALLDAQAVVEAQEAVANPRVKYHDRPEIPVSCRVPRVQVDNRLVELSKMLVPMNEERGKMKCSAVRAIGNLCCASPENQRVAGQHGAVIAVLRCTKRRPDDKPFITQWAIAALRHMVISCPENQDIVVSIDQQPTGILDRDRLLKDLGVEIEEDDATGKFKVKRVAQ